MAYTTTTKQLFDTAVPALVQSDHGIAIGADARIDHGEENSFRWKPALQCG